MTPMRTFAATDAQGYSIWFLAPSWPEAEAIAARNGFSGLGLLDSVYPAPDSVVRWAADKEDMQ